MANDKQGNRDRDIERKYPVIISLNQNLSVLMPSLGAQRPTMGERGKIAPARSNRYEKKKKKKCGKTAFDTQSVGAFLPFRLMAKTGSDYVECFDVISAK